MGADLKPKLIRAIDAWDLLNEVAFGGEMARPSILVWYRLFMSNGKKQIPLHGAYAREAPKTGKPTIYLATYRKDKYKKEYNQMATLFHEMVHQYVDQILDGHEEAHHGKVFHEVYNEAMEKLEKWLRR